MPKQTGIYWKLRDPSLSWSQRVKVARYLWKFDHVRLPNKHQAVLDWLCISLGGKIRVEGKDSEGVWQCMHDVLLTKRCRLASHGRPLLLKTGFCQALLEKLHNMTQKKSDKHITNDVIISCAESIVTSPTVSQALCGRYDFMLPLTVSAVVLFHQQLVTDGKVSTKLLNLLTAVLEKFVTVQKQKASPVLACTQVSSTLLRPALLAINSASNYTELQEARKLIQGAVLSAIFSRDLFAKYEGYLKARLGESKWKAHKSTEVLFTVLSDMVKQDPAQQEAVTKFLPEFYRVFITTFKLTSNNPETFYMFQVLCDTVGADVTKTSCENEALVLAFLRNTLNVMVKYDVYSVTYDNLHDNKQLAWLQKLVTFLLNLTLRNEDWFLGTTSLLSLSHLTTESKLTSVLTSVVSEKNAAAHKFAQSLITTYEKLHQMDKFVVKLLNALKKGEEPTELSPQFLKQLSSTFTSQPLITSQKIWTLLLKAATDSASTAFPGVCCLLTSFLQSVNVDGEVTPQISELMTQTSDVLIARIKEGLTGKTVLSPPLQSLWAWGELHLLLSRYKHNYTCGTPAVTPSAVSYDDLTPMHPGLERKEWAQLCKGIRESEDKRSLYLLELLCVQKLRKILLLSGGKLRSDVTSHDVTSIKNVVTFICDLTPLPSRSVEGSSWDGEVSSINEENWCVAHWMLICRHLSLAVSFCSEEQLLSLSSYLLHSITQANMNSSSDAHTLYSVSASFAPEFFEYSTLTSALVTSVIFNINKLFTAGKKKSPKKAKSSWTLVHDLLSPLCDATVEWCQPKVGKLDVCPVTWHPLKLVSDKILDLMKPCHSVPVEKYSEETETRINQYLRVLSLGLVEHISVTDKSRILLTVLTVMLTNKFVDDNQEPEQVLAETTRSELLLTETAISLPLLLLDGVSVPEVFTLVDGNALLNWMIVYYPVWMFKKVAHSKHLYRQILSRLLRLAVQNTLHLADLQDFVDNITGTFSFLMSDCSASQKSPTEVKYGMLMGPTIVLATLSKVLQRSYVRDDLKKLCSTYFERLRPGFLTLVKYYIKNRDKMDAVQPLVLEGFIAIVGVLCKEGHESLSAVKGLMQIVCELCVDTIDLGKNREATAQAFKFVKLVTSRAEKIHAHCSTNFLYEAWKSLLNRKKQHHHSNSDNQSEVRLTSGTTECMIELPNQEAILEKDLDDVLASVLSACSVEHFSAIVSSLVEAVSTENLTADKRTEITISLELFTKLSAVQLNDDKRAILKTNTQSLVLELQHVALASKINEFSSEVYLRIFNVQAALLKAQPSLLTSETALICLHSCVSCPLDDVTSLPVNEDGVICPPADDVTRLPTFCALFQAYYNVLNEMIHHHTGAVLNSIPAFLGAAKRLMFAVMLEGDQRKGDRSEAELNQLVACASLVERLFSAATSYKVEMARVAPYIVADYVDTAQKVTLWPRVKKAVLLAVYQFLDICDTHSIALLQAALNPGVREIFRTLHEEFNKYHKYKRKI